VNYLLHLGVIAGLVLIVSYSLNLTMGYGGVLAFCYSIFTGAGAYTYALAVAGSPDNSATTQLLVKGQLPALSAFLLAALIAALLGFLVGVLVLCFRGDFLVFATIAFQMVWTTVVQNATPITNGVFSISGVPKPVIAGWLVKTPADFCLLLLVANALIISCIITLCRSPFGKSLIALRDDMLAAQSLGISARTHLVAAFTISAACSGIAGAIIAAYFGYVAPIMCDLNASLFFVTVLLLGGGGNLYAPLAGVAFMTLIPELLRQLHLPFASEASFRQVIYGVTLIILMYARPQGLAGSFQVK